MKNNQFCSGAAGDGTKPASGQEPKPTILPVLGQKGSMTEIPVQAAPAKPQGVVQPAITSPTHRLVERFRKLEPRCRELMRRRLYGLKKRGASTTDIETEAQQLLTPPFGPDSQRLFMALARAILQEKRCFSRFLMANALPSRETAQPLRTFAVAFSR